MLGLTPKPNSQDRTDTLPLFSQPYQLTPLVLIFEENEENRLMLKTLLEMWNYNVEIAGSGNEIIPIAQSCQPDLIIINISLAFVDGLSTLRRIREIETLRNTPVIFTSGHAQPEFRRLATAFGSNDFLVKPLDFDQLEETINIYTNRSFYK